MTRGNSSLIFIIILVVIMYSIGFVIDIAYNRLVEANTTYIFEKETILDLDDNSKDISNRQLKKSENKLAIYEVLFEKSAIITDENTNVINQPNWYLMIEKPDCQYFEVIINNHMIENFGNLNGKSNLWNGIYFIRFNQSSLKEYNSLSLLMYSDYMRGIAGNVRIVSSEQFYKLSNYLHVTDIINDAATIISFFSAFILSLVIIAWRKQLYNIKVYIYFFIAILGLGISLLDFNPAEFIFLNYTLFKKAIVISQHVSVTFAGMAVAQMLNCKHKFNIDLFGLLGSIIASIIISDLINFRTTFMYLNIFLIIGTLQIIITLIYKRKRSSHGAIALLFGFILSLLSLFKILIIIFTNQLSITLVDFPILAINMIVLVMYIFYLELTLSVGVNMNGIKTSFQDVTGFMQGTFSIDSTLSVTGSFSTSCNHIFDCLITGKNLTELLPLNENDTDFLKRTMVNVFDDKYSFKDGFLDLLPNEILINERYYQINYMMIKNNHLSITLTDITKSKELKKENEFQKSKFTFIINALLSKKELGYLLKRTEDFLIRFREEGIQKHLLQELHTIKGNLGQFGLKEFELKVHEIETRISEDDQIDINRICDELHESMNHSLVVLKEYIPDNFFEEATDQQNVKIKDLKDLERLYLETTDDRTFNDTFYKELKLLRKKDIGLLLIRYVDYIDKLAAEYEVLLHPFELIGDEVLVVPDKVENLLEVMIAIYRNAIVHGLETPEERIKTGKEPVGRITTEIINRDPMLIIKVKDDGKGIAGEHIYTKALDKRIVEENEALSEQEKVNMIFLDNISEKESIDIMAGRGIGLSAVYTEAKNLNGTVLVNTEIGQWTEIVLSIPLESIKD